jgi:uncharacterized protein
VSVFCDTSALLAVIIASDRNHPSAAGTWQRLLDAEETLVTTNYVMLELCSIAQRRLGLSALQLLATSVLPAIRVQWVDENRHSATVAAVLAANRRELSIVDCTSFLTMRDLGITHAFAFDPHFVEQGFDVDWP